MSYETIVKQIDSIGNKIMKIVDEINSFSIYKEDTGKNSCVFCGKTREFGTDFKCCDQYKNSVDYCISKISVLKNDLNKFKVIKDRYEQSKISKRAMSASFSDITEKANAKTVDAMKRKSSIFLVGEKESCGIYITATSAVTQDAAINSFVNSIIENYAYDVVVTHFTEFASIADSRKTEEFTLLLNRYASCDVFVIKDFCMPCEINLNVQMGFRRVFDHRYNNFLPVVISSQIPIDRLPLDKDIKDKMSAFCNVFCLM